MLHFLPGLAYSKLQSWDINKDTDDDKWEEVQMIIIMEDVELENIIIEWCYVRGRCKKCQYLFEDSLYIYIYIYIIWTNTNSENAHFMLESLTGNVKVGSQITHWASIELKSAMDIIIWIGHQPMIDVSGMYIHFIVTKLIKLYFWVTFTIQMGNNGHQNPKMNNSYIIIITSPWTLRSIQPLPQNFLLNPLN